MAKTYGKIVGTALFIVGILGFLVNNKQVLYLHFETMHNVVHLVTGVIGLWAGFKGSAGAAKSFALIFGVVYTLIAVLGFANVSIFADLLRIPHLNDMAYNAIHLIVGLWGIAAGLAKS